MWTFSSSSSALTLARSMRYLKSAAYLETYGDNPVWLPYRRNFPGQWAPKKTRTTCVRQGQLTTGNISSEVDKHLSGSSWLQRVQTLMYSTVASSDSDSPLKSDSPKDSDAQEEGAEEDDEGKAGKMERKKEPVARHLDKDRTKVIPVETSMRYLKSAAYRETYGDNPVWLPYRRNFPGQWAPKKTRKTCVRQGQLTTGNPCPICRDIYLVIDYRNVDLLKQFISPYTGQVLHWDKTGVCRHQQASLLIEIERAKDYGLITFDVPFREYDYQEYQQIYQSYSKS